MLGRSSASDRARAERVQAWVSARSPYALLSVFAGVLGVIDAVTLVIGVVMGLAAVVLGVLGFKDIKQRDHLCGRGLCITGVVLGVLALVLSGVVWVALGVNSGPGS